MSDDAAFEGWAVLELMGHRRLGGYVSEAELAGGKFIRIDVPEPDQDSSVGSPGRPLPNATRATQLYGASAVFCLTPTDEATARAVAKASVAAPVSRWELRGLAASSDDDFYDG